MLQKLSMLCTMLLIVCASAFSQLPYAKMLDLSDSDLKEKKFKYDKDKNRYAMSKSNNTNKTMNVLSAVAGNAADIKPHKDDYTITLQKGVDNQTSFVSVLFFNDDTYHTIATWVAENDITPIETSSGKLRIQKFNYENYSIELTTELVSVKTTTTNTFAAAKSFDESYNVYTYAIYTGVAPESKWHTKEAQKKEKNKLKGKKEDLDDLM